MTSDVPAVSADDNSDNGENANQAKLDFPNLDEIAKEIGGDENKAKEFVLMVQRSFMGPLPPPEVLKQYDESVPGAAKMIMDEFHLQGAHRRSLESDTISSNNKQSSRGQIFAFIIGISGISGAVVCGIYDAPIVGSVIGGAHLFL